METVISYTSNAARNGRNAFGGYFYINCIENFSDKWNTFSYFFGYSCTHILLSVLPLVAISSMDEAGLLRLFRHLYLDAVLHDFVVSRSNRGGVVYVGVLLASTGAAVESNVFVTRVKTCKQEGMSMDRIRK